MEHWSLVSLFQSGDTISILTMPESKGCFCTFGVVFHGHSRVVRKFEFGAEDKSYIAAHVSGSGRVQALAISVGWNTTGHWEGISRLLCYLRPQGEASAKRSLPEEMLSAQMRVGALPFFSVAVFEVARWYFEDYYAQERRQQTEDHHLVAKVLGPSYISGCAQWGDIKDDEMLTHAARM